MTETFGSILPKAARALLVFALLAAWQSALLHPLEHADVDGRLVHLGGVGSTDDKQPGSDPSSELCDALAALTACAIEARASFAVTPSEYLSPLGFSGVRPTSSAPPFFAQAPPLSC